MSIYTTYYRWKLAMTQRAYDRCADKMNKLTVAKWRAKNDYEFHAQCDRDCVD